MSKHTSFDQRNEQIGLATGRGFITYELTSGIVLYEAHFPVGGANCISLLSDSNLVALSGDDTPDGFSKQSVVIWDCNNDKVVKTWNVQNPIENLLFRTDCLVVVHGDQINFYDCCDFEMTFTTKIPSPSRCCVALVQSNAISHVAYPSPNGDCLNIADYHDPGYIIGSLPLAFNKISFFAFDSKGELLAIAVDDAKTVQLWSVMELRLIAKYKRGFRGAEINSITFDKLSNFFIMSTKKGTMYVYAIPTPAERNDVNTSKAIRSKFSYEFPKGSNYNYQFDIAGYVITGITDDGTFKQVRLDIDHGTVVNVCDRKLEV
ncbi:hypothetical protein TRFO_10438 [Tritrichomonas foetus]|uniref:Uncharacterized protein n=1 Tax=Tritrichomonas foetus TaxID=1144522 RepID=A0A1J4JE63_9EUKA|nr:hypothetical protein TRFO_10438 [Tritrichomonas foetus]|eukprot:OHS95548.1 hypothetical protein TRFO_10438 [Tritrichomonas foetus]